MKDIIQKAEDLVLVFGKETALKVVDIIITELQLEWNQDRIDFYLEVRFLITKK